MSDAQIHREASSNEYYSVNRLKKVLCVLCNALCRDDANFLVHIEGKNHKTNKERAERNRRLAKLRQQRQLAQQAAGAGIGGSSGVEGDMNGGLSSTAVVAPYGLPAYRVSTDPMPDVQCCKVRVEAAFPNVMEDSRPLHRWVNSYEQSQEARESGVVYLLIACQGYETIAMKFPSQFPRTNDRDALEGKYECLWDAEAKVFSLFFIIG